MTGLLGLDGVHHFQAELHPVLALAADVSHEPHDPDVQAWLVMIRNMGDEGECSAGALPWVTPVPRQYVLEIPWQPGADSVSIETGGSRFGFVSRRPPTLSFQPDRGRALRIVASLPVPTSVDSLGLVYGTLHLKWFKSGSAIPRVAPQVRPVPQQRGRRRVKGDKHDYPLTSKFFPHSQQLCQALKVDSVPAPVVNRTPPKSWPPQAALNDTATPFVTDSAAPCAFSARGPGPARLRA